MHRWIGLDGKTRTQSFYTEANPAPSPGGAAAVTAALQAASHAGLWYWRVCPISVPNTTPTTGDYPSVLDYAQLIYRTAAKTTIRITIPAPLTSIFLAGNEKVNPANALIVALTASLVGNATDSNGNAIVAFVSGKRLRLKIPFSSGA